MGIRDFAIDFFSLEGKTAIVTGGNTGLGRTFALALAAAGANLFIPSIREDDGTTRQLIENEGVKMEFMLQDITEPGAAKKIVDNCVEAYSSLDILVNSAGLSKNVRDVLKFGRSEWDAMLNVNLTAPFELSYEAAKVMIPRRRGKIINVCSMYSFLGGQWSPAKAIEIMLQGIPALAASIITSVQSGISRRGLVGQTLKLMIGLLLSSSMPPTTSAAI